MSDKKKAAIYCRVANEDADAIERQEAQLRDYVLKHGYRDIAIYADNGYSGIRINRPAFKRMESDIEDGMIGVVLCMNITRISRDWHDLANWFDRIKQSGVSFISVSDGVTGSSFMDVRKSLWEANKEHRLLRR